MPSDRTLADEMYKKRYFEIADLLDEALGTDEGVRTGEGIVQDVYLLVQLQQEAAQRAGAIRQMANEANARLRSLLLAALGIEDDGRTPLADYVVALVAARDAALAAGRKQAAADAEAAILAAPIGPYVRIERAIEIVHAALGGEPNAG